MYLPKIVFLFPCFSAIFFSTLACPEGSIQGMESNICYYLINNNLTWLAAESDCIQKGGHLASIDGVFVNSYLRGIAEADGLITYWIGGTNLVIPDSWSWIDGNRWKYTAWAPGFPQNLDSCIIQSSSDGFWKNIHCSATNSYVCQVGGDATPPPTPATVTRCPGDLWRYSSITQKCYYYVTHLNTSASEASFFCQNLNSTLVSIHSYPENSIVAGLGDEYLPSREFWIGLSCTNTDCEWSDSSKYGYTQWYSQAVQQGSTCATILGWNFATARQDWNTHDCSELLPFVCQISSLK